MLEGHRRRRPESCVDGAGPLIDHFERHMVIDGELDDEQRTALLRIADKCPVHRTLEASSHITTTIDQAV